MKALPWSASLAAVGVRCFGLVIALDLIFTAGCAKPVVPVSPAYEGALAPSTKPWAPAAKDSVGGSVKRATLRLRLSADHTAIVEAGFSVRDLQWSRKEEAVTSAVSMESSEWSAAGPFPIRPDGNFAVPALGIEGRFTSPTQAAATIHLTYHFNLPSFGGTPGTFIPGTPDITLPDGTVIPGTSEINIPGTPQIAGGDYTVELGTWDCLLNATTDTGPLTPPPLPAPSLPAPPVEDSAVLGDPSQPAAH